MSRVSFDQPGPTVDLGDRYGRRASRRPLAITLTVLLAAAFLGWLAWATWFHATPAVRSEFISFKVHDEHRVTAVVDVDLDDEARDAECVLRVLAEDHSVVGELPFEPVDGRNTEEIRTEREATSVTLVGCTAKGQPRPQ